MRDSYFRFGSRHLKYNNILLLRDGVSVLVIKDGEQWSNRGLVGLALLIEGGIIKRVDA